MVHQCSAERGTAQGREREREKERETASEHHSAHTTVAVQQSTHINTPPFSQSLSLSLSLSLCLPPSLSLSLSLSLSHFLTHTHLLSHTDTGTQECRGSAVRSSTGQRSLSRMSFVSLNQNWSFSVLFSAVTDNPVNKAPPATCSSTPPAHLTTTDEPPWLKLARSCEVPWRPPWSLLPVWLLCFSAIFFFFFGKLIQGLSLASSWVIMPQRLPGGSAWQTLTHWMVGQTNRLPQTAATTILSNQRPGNQVQKGIRGDYLGHPGFFTIGGDVERSCTLCAERLPSVAACSAAPCCGKGRKEEQGPKQIMLSSAWMPSNHSSPLPLCRNPPPQRDPLCNPNWELVLLSGCLRLKAPRHPAHVLYLVRKHWREGAKLWQLAGSTPDVFTRAPAATGNCTVV